MSNSVKDPRELQPIYEPRFLPYTTINQPAYPMAFRAALSETAVFVADFWPAVSRSRGASMSPETAEEANRSGAGRGPSTTRGLAAMRAWCDEPRLTWWFVVLVAALFALRKPWALHTPQLHAEDGSIFSPKTTFGAPSP